MRKETARKDQADRSAETRRRRKGTEGDPMKCAVWFTSVPVRTSMYQYVLVCTMHRLNLSSFEIRLRHIVSHA